MDRRRAAFLAGALAAALAVPAPAAPPPLRALQWLSPSADPVIAMTLEPAECLARRADFGRQDAAIEVGRAAFRSPLLLGGQAARAGLACESCHRAGRGNPQFQFPGLSGEPGTADVTSSLMSSHRGNGVADPKPIPDLSADKAGLSIPQGAAAGALEPFLRGLIVEEFDGPAPPAAVLAGLAAYVRALDPTHCPGSPGAPVTAGGHLQDSRRAVRAARDLARAGDREAAAVMLAAARARLGLIDERYASSAFSAEKAALGEADQALAKSAATLRNYGGDVGPQLQTWLERSERLQTLLERRQARSLYAPKQLRAALRQPLPGKAP